MPKRACLPSLLVILLGTVAMACSDNGSLLVTTVTTGEVGLAPVGYTILVDEVKAGRIDPNGTFTVAGLSAGGHEVRILGPPDCTPAGETTRHVTVPPEATAEVAFEVLCESAVLAEGTLAICGACTVDFDEGIVRARLGVDILYNAVTEAECYLQPPPPSIGSGGRIRLFGGNEAPGKSGCMQPEAYAADSVSVESLLSGTFVCVRTDQGRFSEVKVVSQPASCGGSLLVDYRTFQ